MKRYLSLLAAVITLIAFCLSGCSIGEISRESELKASVESTYDELTSTFSGESGQYGLVSEYLKSWAGKNDITMEANSNNYTVLTNPATDGYEDRESTLLQCGIRTDDFSASMQPLATALTALLGPENHGDIALIVTEIDNGEFTGASSVSKRYLQYDNFINIDQSDDVLLNTGGSYEMTSTMTAPITTDSPSYSNAFDITMSISGYHDPFNFDEHYPNPIETIGNLLANEKSSGQLFTLVSFESETTDGYTPTSATATVVVDSNDIDSFTKKFNSSYNNMKDRFESLNDNFVYTLTETSMPEVSMDSQTSDNIISLMYTLQSGVYLQDEDDGSLISASDISSVSTSDGKFRLTMTSRSTDSAVLDEMADVFLTTSGLCGISYSVSDKNMTWSSDSETGPAPYLTDALGSDEPVVPASLENSECCIFASKADLNMVSYRCNLQHMEIAMMNIIHFIENLAQ